MLNRQISRYGGYDKLPQVVEAKQNGLLFEYNKLILSLPMLCDFLASVLLMIGYINIAASIAQMIGSLIVFVTALEAVIFLNKKLYRHHWVGAWAVVLGI